MSPTDDHFCVIDADSESADCWGQAFGDRNWRGGALKGYGFQAAKFASLVYWGPSKCNRLKCCSFFCAALVSSTLTLSCSFAQTYTV